MKHLLILAALGVAGYLVWKRYDGAQTVKVKEGVDVGSLNAPVAWALGVAERIFEAFGADVTVTSGNDGKHMTGSKHFTNDAADLRTSDLKPGVAAQITALLRAALSALGFDVVDEGDHIHLEYDPKPGREWLRTVK